MLEEIEKGIKDDDSASPEERLLLYALIRNLKPKVVVETGTHRGKATLFMAQALAENGEGVIYTADPNATKWGAEDNFAEYPEINDRIVLFEGRGDEMGVDGKIDFMFIDGLHEKEEVLSEMQHFAPMMHDKTVVVFHDCKRDNSLVGVNEAVELLGLRNIALATHNYIRIASPLDPI